MKFTDFIVEMPDTPPSPPERVDKPVPENKFELEKEKKFKVPAQPKQLRPKGFISQMDFARAPFKNVEQKDLKDSIIKTLPKEILGANGLPIRHKNLNIYGDQDQDQKLRWDFIKQFTGDVSGEYTHDEYEHHDDGAFTKDPDERSVTRFLQEKAERMYIGESNAGGEIYRQINEYLRGNGKDDDHFIKSLTALLLHQDESTDRGMRWDRSEGPEHTFRGLTHNPFRNLNVGEIIQDPGFMSTSDSYTKASNPIFHGENGVTMDILGGKNGRNLFNRSEGEYLYQPNTKLKYVGRYGMGDIEADRENYQNNIGDYMFEQVDGSKEEDYELKESVKLKKPRISKLMKEISDAFKERMDDFQFEVLKPEEEPEQEAQQPEPKQFRDVLKQMVDIDD